MKTVDKVIVSASIVVFMITQIVTAAYESHRNVVMAMNAIGWIVLLLLVVTIIQLVFDKYENTTTSDD